MRADAVLADRVGVADPLEQALDRQVDQYRELLRGGSAKTALKLFRKFQDELPPGASAKLRFRVKANIGHCYIQMGDFVEAQRWLLEGYGLAPSEPNAVANKALAFILAERFMDALEVCRAALKTNSGNELAASYLLQAAVPLSEIVDPLELIPLKLREKDEVVLAHALFLRGRERRPEWWTFARNAAKRFPANKTIALLASESYVEEAIQHPDFQRERKLVPELREALLGAATILDDHWAELRSSEVPTRPDALGALVNAMVAHQALGDFSKAVELAREVTDRARDEASLTNAFQVAQVSNESELAERALDAIAIPSARVKFFRAMLHLERNEWEEAAECLAVADVPDTERCIADTVIRLTSLRESKSPADEAEFSKVLKVAAPDPRSLVMVARVALFRGFSGIAEEAQGAALKLITPESSLMARGMVGAYLADRGEISGMIDVLDGHVPVDRPSRELQWLADAHASERPARERNLKFFESLPPEVVALPSYARSHGNVLLDRGDVPGAETRFRTAVEAHPEDTFSVLKLSEALHRLGHEAEAKAKAFVLGVQEDRLLGPPEHQMAFARLLLNFGQPSRALRYAYQLVRKHSDNPRIAMGYVGLVFGDKDENIIPDSTTVAADTWVVVESAHGDRNAFIVDAGEPFLGIDVLGPEHEFVKRITGLKVGDTVELPKPFGVTESWSVVEIKSKYLQVLHVLMNDFERRFPNHGGMWRFSVKEGDVAPVLDLIRKKSEADREIAKSYTEKAVPLAFVARMMGGRPGSFAHFLRRLGIDVLTCQGGLDERDAAIAVAVAFRGTGVVLDEFTVWVAAEMGILDILKAWFGRVLIPQVVIDAIDDLIEDERAGLGHRTMTVGWHDGQFLKQDVTDELIQQQVAALEKLKSDILEHCEPHSVVLPDGIGDFTTKVVKLIDDHALDPVYLALKEHVPLLSDDLRYRSVAAVIGLSEGLWIQAALIAALRAGVADSKRAYAAFVQLAARKHKHVTLDQAALRGVLEVSQDTLTEFDAVTDYIGSPDADMVAHVKVTAALLLQLWSSDNPDLKVQRATGMITSKLLRYRTDWFTWLALLIVFIRGNSALLSYLTSWLAGHFLPFEPVNKAFQQWTRPSQAEPPEPSQPSMERKARRGHKR